MNNKPTWPIVRLLTLAADIKGAIVGGPFGSDLVSRDYVSSGVPVVRGGNLPNNAKFSYNDIVFVSERKADSLRLNCASPGDIVFTQRGTLGQVGLIPKNSPFPRFLISQSQMKMTVDIAKADPLYLYYYFRLPSTISYIQIYALQAGVPHINLGILRKFEVINPPLHVQQKIVAILSAYDELIEKNQRRIALLEKMSEEIYREWFVRLRFPGYEKAKFVKGVPDGWIDQKFGQFCQLQRGYDLPDADVEPGLYPVIASTSIKAYHSQYKVEPPVITTGRSGSLGKVLLVHTRAWPHNTTLYVKQFFGNSVFLVYYTLKNMQLENFNAGAGVPTLNRNHLNGIPIIAPNKELQNRFDDVVSKFHVQVELLKKSSENLAITRDRLLPRLISGKLSVENLDIQIPPGMTDELKAEQAAHA